MHVCAATMRYHLILAARELMPVVFALQHWSEIKASTRSIDKKRERETWKKDARHRHPHLTNLCCSLFVNVGFIFPPWNAFNSSVAPVTVRFVLHSPIAHTHTNIHAQHIHQTHGLKFIVVYEMNTGILLNAFQMHIIRFGMFDSYIIGWDVFASRCHSIFSSIGAHTYSHTFYLNSQNCWDVVQIRN